MTIGAVLEEAWTLFTRFFLRFFVIALVVFGILDGPGSIFTFAPPALTQTPDVFGPRWVTLTFLAAAAIVCLPREFQVMVVENFDERHYGFASVVDLLRAAGKEGVLRIERDRQGAVRVFPGANLAPRPVAPPVEEPVDLNETIDVEVPAATIDSVEAEAAPAVPPIVEGEPVQDTGEPVAVAEVVVEEKPKRGRSRKTAGTRARRTRKPRVSAS